MQPMHRHYYNTSNGAPRQQSVDTRPTVEEARAATRELQLTHLRKCTSALQKQLATMKAKYSEAAEAAEASSAGEDSTNG